MKALLLTLALFLPLLCSAQPTQLCPGGPVAITIAEDNTATVLAFSTDSRPTTRALLQKYNIISGAMIWEKDLGRTNGKSWEDPFEHVKHTKDGGYIIATQLYNQYNLIKADSEGNVLWQNQEVTDVRAITETNDGEYIIIGSSSPGYISKITATGQVQWIKPIRETEGVTCNAIIKTKDNQFLVVGKVDKLSNTGDWVHDILVVKLNAEGNELWHRKFDIAWKDEATAVAEATNSDIMVTGYIQDYETEVKSGLLLRLNSDGQEVWSKAVNHEGGNNEIQLIEPIDDESFIAIGTKTPFGTTSGTAYKVRVNATGSFLSEEDLGWGRAFYLVNTPLQQIAVVEQAPCLVVYRGDGENGGNCDIQTTISATGALDLCPGETVTLSAGEGFASYRWNTGQTTSTITVSQAGEYRVEVTNEIGCPYATDPVTVTVKQPFSGDQICYVTVDNETGKNKIIWNKTPDQNTAAYNIYKDAVGGPVKVGSTVFDATASLIDNDSQPDSRTERYVLKAVDNCGNESVESASHKTVLLQASLGTTGEVNLTWNKYEGVPALKTVIYRGRDNNSLSSIAELTGQEDRYIDRNPISEEKVYRIGIELDANCSSGMSGGSLSSPTSHAMALSNTLNLQVNGLADDYEKGSKWISIWPNPMERDATITVEKNQSQPVKLQVLNVTGQLVRQQNVSSYAITLYKGSLPAGFYMVAVTLKNGNTLKKKIILK